MGSNSCHKWLVFVVVFLLSSTHYGVIFSFGAIFVTILDTFQEERSTTAVVQSLLVGVALSFGFISGILVSKYGVMKVAIAGSILTPAGFISSYFASSVLYLDISIAIVAGIGISFIYISGSVALVHTFEGSQKLLVLPLQSAAISVGTITYPYLFNGLVNQYGLNGTFLILGGIYLNSFVFVMLLASGSWLNTKSTTNLKSNYSKNQTERNVDDGKINKATISYPSNVAKADIPNTSIERDDHDDVIKQKKNKGVLPSESTLQSGTPATLSGLCTKQYILLVTGASFAIASLNGLMVIIVDIYVWKGFTVEEGLFIYIPYSICSLISRVLPGLVKQKQGINSLVLPIIYCMCGFSGTLLLMLSFNYNLLLLGTSLIGITQGGLVAAFAVIGIKMVGTRLFGVGIGLLFTITGLMSAMAGPLYGALMDLTKSYTSVLIVTAVVQMIGLVLIVLTLISRNASKQNEIRNSEPGTTITRL